MTDLTQSQIIYALTHMGDEQSAYQLACNTRAGAVALHLGLGALIARGKVESYQKPVGTGRAGKIYRLAQKEGVS